MLQRRIRRGVAWMLVALLPTLQACYEYVTLATDNPPAGQLVELQITDQGRVSLSDRFGPGLTLVAGRVDALQANDFVVNVYRVTHLTGESTQWSGEAVRLNRGFVGSVKGRKLSAIRTTLVAVAVGTVLYFTAGRALTGGGKDPLDPPDPIQPPLSTRIPIGARIRMTP
ncbi:MAG: hypothetical protein ABJF01_16275 [bacterium]